MNEIQRIKTYVKKLDVRLGGGVPKKHIVLVTGPTGSMKSSLCYSIIYNSAKEENIKSIYISLEQSRESLLQQMESLGLSLSSVKDNVIVSDVGVLRKLIRGIPEETSWLESIIAHLKTVKEVEKIELAVIDSLNALNSMSRKPFTRDELYHFFEKLREMELTTFIISETKIADYTFEQIGGEVYLADCIFHLDLEKDKRTLNLLLGVLKMRSTQIDRTYFPLVYKENKFAIIIE